MFPVGDSYAFMIKTGDYFITYLNIDHPAFQRGDSVKTGQFLGLLYHDASPYQLELMLNNKNDKEFDLYEWFGLNQKDSIHY
jgi:hypothetical protein